MGRKMLWSDKDRTEKFEKIVEEAVAYYSKKYGVLPNVCYVNPVSWGEDLPDISGLEIIFAREVQPFHLLIGVSG